MVVVTDKKYYLDNNIIEMTNIAMERQRKNWDNLWIYDGDEGSGKSSMAIAHCYYIAQQTGKNFTTKNIFFNLDKLMDFASRTEKEVILWDEAALGALSTQWQNKTQNKLVQALMVCRKKGHFWVFCIPKFHELRRYISRRAMGLIHIYSPDGIRRGNFCYYRKSKKDWLYEQVKKTRSESWYREYTFRGKFIDYGKKPIIDWEEYDKLKDEAIMEMFGGEDEMTKKEQRLIQVKYAFAKFAEYYNVPQHIACTFANAKQKTISDWKLLDQKYPELLEKMGLGPSAEGN